jgi:hypothetical protein
MATCVFYIDEAGSPEGHTIPLKNGQTPLFSLGAVAFNLNDWRVLDRQFLALKRHYFPDWLSASSQRDEYYEIKGNELTAPRSASSERKHAYLGAVLSFIKDNGGVCFGVTTIKNQHRPAPAKSIYTCSLQILAERFHQYLIESQQYDNAILVCDSRKGMGRKQDIVVVKSYMSYIFGHSIGRTFIKLSEAPFFADSRVTAGLQISDNFTSTLFTYNYTHNIHLKEGFIDYSHMQRYWPILNQLEFKSSQSRLFGFRKITHQ